MFLYIYITDQFQEVVQSIKTMSNKVEVTNTNLSLPLILCGYVKKIKKDICFVYMHNSYFILFWQLREKNYTRLCSTKSMLVVNDSFPGPVIHVHKGDTVFVNVHNQGNYGVTIHWYYYSLSLSPLVYIHV
jgi:hypothetical protein